MLDRSDEQASPWWFPFVPVVSSITGLAYFFHAFVWHPLAHMLGFGCP